MCVGLCVYVRVRFLTCMCARVNLSVENNNIVSPIAQNYNMYIRT